jgi:hypothetical protein
MFSRAKEFSLRKWHREKIHKYGNTHRYSDNVTIEFLFGVAEPEDKATLDAIRQEINSYGTDTKHDLVMFDFKETEACMHHNRCLTRNAHALFQNMKNSLCTDVNHDGSQSYEATYFVKMDDDVVLNYELLARVFLEFPTESVHFGRMLPNIPSTGKEERNFVSFAHVSYPLWPQGAFRGFSKDILDLTLLPQNVATVLREEHSYFFLDSDRAAGALIERAQIPVKHRIFTKGYYFMCSTENITCESYWNAVAFHVGFGLSGDDSDKIIMKLETMNQVLDSIQQCDLSYDSFNVSDHYFFIDDSFLQSSATEWLSHGCSSVDTTARSMIDSFEHAHVRQKQLELDGSNIETCAEQTYDWKVVGSSSQTNATDVATILIKSESGTRKSSISVFASAFLEKMSAGDPTKLDLPAKSHFFSWGVQVRVASILLPLFSVVFHKLPV